jgi:hypothetical protein
MTTIIFDNGGKAEKPTVLSSQELATLLAGSSILWADEKDGVLHLKTSDEFLLRFSDKDKEIFLSIISHGDAPFYRIKISTGYTPSAHEIEIKIRALRQLYALLFLLHAGRAGEISKDAQYIDLEQKLLAEKEHLHLTAASIGSFWVTLANWTKEGAKSIATIVSLFWDEGRQNLLRRLKARTESDELDVEKKRSDLDFDRATKLVALYKEIEKIKDPMAQQCFLHAFRINLERLGIDPSEIEAAIESSKLQQGIEEQPKKKPR